MAHEEFKDGMTILHFGVSYESFTHASALESCPILKAAD